MHDIARRLTSCAAFTALIGLIACSQDSNREAVGGSRIEFHTQARVMDAELTEISGIEVADGPTLLVHNDDGPPDLWYLDVEGEVSARFRLQGASNRDWEDLTLIPRNGRTVIAIGDIGDNERRRSSVQVYFLVMPAVAPNGARDELQFVDVLHTLELTYPDGPHDCEAIAYDASSDTLLFLTKRDRPPRLYGVDASEAIARDRLALRFLGTVPTLRPPTRDDFRRLGKEADWISQPTGMDINADSSLAAVITYRSLYLFDRQADESWIEAFNRPPREFLGPASRDEEAIAFSGDMTLLYISAEGHPAPIYRVALPASK